MRSTTGLTPFMMRLMSAYATTMMAKLGAMTNKPAARQEAANSTMLTARMPKRSVSEPMTGCVAMLASDATEMSSDTWLAAYPLPMR